MMIYLAQNTMYTGLMLLLYLLLLRNRTMHRFNRSYLLLTAILPAVIPLIKLPGSVLPIREGAVLNGYLDTIKINGDIVSANDSVLFLPYLFWGVYLLGVLWCLIALLFSYYKLHRLIRSCERKDKEGYILLKNTGYGPGSWGRFVLLPGSTADVSIIRHEQAHISLKHSWDIVFMSLIQAFFWPNFFLHLLKKELVEVHEFQADAVSGTEKDNYAQLLLSSVFATGRIRLTHTFIDHPIKRRIMMLYKKQSKSNTRGIITIVLAGLLVSGLVTLQSCEQKKEKVTIPVVEPTELTKMPEPDYNLYEFIADKIKYPEDAKTEGVEGRIAVKFMIDENGNIIDVQIANKEYDPRLGKAALDAVKQLPAWSPGEKSGVPVRVYYTIPVTFKLGADNKENTGLIDQVNGNKEFRARMDRNAGL